MTNFRGGRHSGSDVRGLPYVHKWRLGEGESGVVLLEYLARELLISENEAADLIDFGSVYIRGRVERDPKSRIDGPAEIVVNLPHHGIRRFYEIDPSRILFRDRRLLAYNKEPGVPTQQTPADAYNNLYAGLRRYLEKESGRPTYVALHHRLDRETGGVIVFALDRSVNRTLGEAFIERRVAKDYLTWVEGAPARDIWVSTEDIGKKAGRFAVFPKGRGKEAETAFQTLHRENDRSLIWARPRTGRTHQIRLHLAAAGHPIIGDRLYGGREAKGLFLHAFRLALPHPATGSKLILQAPLPQDWPPPRDAAIPD